MIAPARMRSTFIGLLRSCRTEYILCPKIIKSKTMEARMDQKQSARRRFLKRSAALAGMAVGAIGSASGQNQNWALGYDPDIPKDLREYGQPSRYAKVVRTSNPALNRATDDIHTPLQDTMGIITPSA